MMAQVVRVVGCRITPAYVRIAVVTSRLTRKNLCRLLKAASKSQRSISALSVEALSRMNMRNGVQQKLEP